MLRFPDDTAPVAEIKYLEKTLHNLEEMMNGQYFQISENKNEELIHGKKDGAKMPTQYP